MAGFEYDFVLCYDKLNRGGLTDERENSTKSRE